jgi:hypothetical protein
MQILCDFSGSISSPKNHAHYQKLSVIITYYKQLNYNLLISACQALKDIWLTNSYQQKLAWLRSKSQRKQQRSASFQLIRFGQILLHTLRRRKIASEANKKTVKWANIHFSSQLPFACTSSCVNDFSIVSIFHYLRCHLQRGYISSSSNEKNHQ